MSEIEDAKAAYLSGQNAFERGNYRQAVTQFERTAALAGKGTILGGQAQLWLANAYAAVGEEDSAIALCSATARHPDPEIAKQAGRLAYILKAPKLSVRPDWVTQIPDLGSLEGGDYALSQSRYGRSSPSGRWRDTQEPIDPSLVNTRENQFVWVALLGCLLVIGGLIWLS